MLEARRGEHGVEAHREIEAVARGKERVDVDDADFGERRRLNLVDERGQIEIAAGRPRVRQHGREEGVLAASRRRLDTGERQQAGRRVARTLAEQLRVVPDGSGRRGKRRQDRHGKAGSAAWRVDGELGGLAQAFDPGAVLPRVRQTLAPELRLLRGKRVGRHPGSPRLVLVNPRPEILRGEPWKCQQQVAQVPLRIDRDDGHAVDRRFLNQSQAESGLAAAGHPDTQGVGHQIARIVKDRFFERFPRFEVVFTAEVEQAKLLEILHA